MTLSRQFEAMRAAEEAERRVAARRIPIEREMIVDTVGTGTAMLKFTQDDVAVGPIPVAPSAGTFVAGAVVIVRFVQHVPLITGVSRA